MAEKECYLFSFFLEEVNSRANSFMNVGNQVRLIALTM